MKRKQASSSFVYSGKLILLKWPWCSFHNGDLYTYLDHNGAVLAVGKVKKYCSEFLRVACDPAGIWVVSFKLSYWEGSVLIIETKEDKVEIVVFSPFQKIFPKVVVIVTGCGDCQNCFQFWLHFAASTIFASCILLHPLVAAPKHSSSDQMDHPEILAPSR